MSNSRLSFPSDRISITGIGAGTPLGWDFETISRNLLAGKSAVSPVQTFDVSQHPCKIGAAIDPIPTIAGMAEEKFRSKGRLDQLALYCAQSALMDAGLWEERQSLKVGLIIGNASDCMWFWEDEGVRLRKEPHCHPDDDRPPLVNIVQGELSLHGPATALSSACASANFAFDMAKQWLDLGIVDVCLAGGCDTGLTPVTLACFGNLRALSRNNDNPQGASRPFDKGRDGFVLGEGGVLFLLEKESRAKKRNARILGHMLGCGLTSDAHHMVIPNPEPVQAARAIRMALDQAGVNPDQIDYINAHGTSTPVGDAAEAKAIRSVFEEHTRTVPVSSTKSMTGHLLTAASALEALACLTTFQYSAIPPTINLDEIDPDCQLNHVANKVREQKVKIALSNSFGFGGSNSCLVLAAA